MFKLTHKILLALLIMSNSMIVSADDIDIIDREVAIDSNVLFIMDLSGSMNETLPLPGDPTRLDELKGAFQDIVTDPDFDKINMGLSVFSGAYDSSKGVNVAHGITFPVSPVVGKDAQDSLSKTGFIHPGATTAYKSYMPDAGSNNTREYLNLLSADPDIWKADGLTPIVDSLYEASMYFKGESVQWGRYTADDVRSAHPSTYTGSLKTELFTPVCNAQTRQSCTKGSCGLNPICEKKLDRQIRKDKTGGINCNVVDDNKVTCPENVTNCGLNCSLKTVWPKTKVCEAAYTTIANCISAHPTWGSCKKKDVCGHYGPKPSEGPAVCDHWIPTITCKEPQQRYVCDAPDTFSCEFEVESCTQCPDPYNKVVGNAEYKTPINKKCPANGIILLTDGDPTVNKRPDLVASKIGSDANGCDAGSSFERCGRELAKHMATKDQNTSIPDPQVVNTFTVGLSLMPNSTASNFLQDVADNGGGSFVNATNRAELAKAFKDAIFALGKKARSFSSPTYTVNPATQLTHGKYVYVPIFDRSIGVAWDGNLKKYELKNGKFYGVDASSNSVEAFDGSGRLIAGVSDLWSASIVGDVIKAGGAASLLDPAARTILTDNGSSLVALGSISPASYNAADNTERNELIKYIKGEKADGTPRHHMGDVIHSKPVQLSYSNTESLIFVGTNEGFLHAIKSTQDITDKTDGKEMFAYMPNELLKNIKTQYVNKSDPYHLYGVDGPMKLWLDDKNNNGIKDSGEDAYLYFGLRRGGMSYYALKLGNSITDKPTLAWIKSKSDSKFSNLGFTWSEPVIAKLKPDANTEAKTVLVFGGGYINDHAGESIDKRGSDVYIVNAETGAHIWDTSQASKNLPFAVPAKIRTIDADRNGSIDRLYFADVGGNVWRVDLGGITNRYDLAKSTVTQIAELGAGKGAGVHARRFFNEPDVAFLKQKGRYALSISIGSGSRPDPLNEVVENHFFVLFDENVFNYPKPSPVFKTITMSDLLDAPLSKTESSELIAKLKAGGKKGWKMNLNPTLSLTTLKGEKVLSSALTFENKIMFTSFGIKEATTIISNNLECGLQNKNSGRLYVLDLLTGGAVLDLDNKGSVEDPKDRSIELVGGEILETPQIVYGDGFTTHDGKQCTKDDCTREYTIHAGKGPTTVGSKTKTNKPILPSKKLPRVYWLDSEQ